MPSLISPRPESLWTSAILPGAFARAFAPLPQQPLWDWADRNVWLENKEAAESGPYRSAKTPHTRRLQELIQSPVMWCYDATAGRWIKVQVREINAMKSSQSGFTEAVLNGVRYKANFRPCNVIYTVDTRETARDISERLLPSLQKLDRNIFTGDDDDVGTFVMRLRAMDIWFQGSFSSGKFASKQAPFVVADEVEEHGEDTKDTSTVTSLKSRKKTADNGLQINLCKPKRKRGPIHKAFLRGNQEEFHITCPHCGLQQWLTFFSEERDVPFAAEIDTIQDEQTGAILARLPRALPPGETRKVKTGRIVFGHCKDLLGRWDKLRILRETYYECGGCAGHIEEHEKSDLIATAEWLPTEIGTPGVVSQHINDLYSTDANSAWGQIVLEYLDAKREGRRELQGFYNHRLGWPWSDEARKTEASDIKANIAGRTGDHCPPYRRGAVPLITYPPQNRTVIIIGADVGGNYARWAAGCVAPNLEDVAVFDWGEEVDPEAIADLMTTHKWPLASHPDRLVVASYGFIDAKFRKTDVYRVCLAVPGRRLIPCAGIGGAAARVVRLWSWNQMPSYPHGFRKLDYNDREAKDALYVDCIKRKKRRVFFPIDVESDPQFIDELCAEEIIEDENGRAKWNEHPPPNHYGDCVKNIVTGLRFLTRKQRVGDPVATG